MCRTGLAGDHGAVIWDSASVQSGDEGKIPVVVSCTMTRRDMTVVVHVGTTLPCSRSTEPYGTVGVRAREDPSASTSGVASATAVAPRHMPTSDPKSWAVAVSYSTATVLPSSMAGSVRSWPWMRTGSATAVGPG